MLTLLVLATLTCCIEGIALAVVVSRRENPRRNLAKLNALFLLLASLTLLALVGHTVHEFSVPRPLEAPLTLSSLMRELFSYPVFVFFGCFIPTIVGKALSQRMGP
jgi:hypothetical protein